MDIQMPGMDGHEATARIREKTQHATLPIIAMTAHAMAGYREECLAAGMNDYVAKPIDPQNLFAVLGVWMKGGEGLTPFIPEVEMGLPPRMESVDVFEMAGVLEKALHAKDQGKCDAVIEAFERTLATTLKEAKHLAESG